MFYRHLVFQPGDDNLTTARWTASRSPSRIPTPLMLLPESGVTPVSTNSSSPIPARGGAAHLSGRGGTLSVRTQHRLRQRFAAENIDARIFFSPLSSLPFLAPRQDNAIAGAGDGPSGSQGPFNAPGFHETVDSMGTRNVSRKTLSNYRYLARMEIWVR